MNLISIDLGMIITSYPVWARIILAVSALVFIGVAVLARKSLPDATSDSRAVPTNRAIVSPGNQSINITGDGNVIHLQGPEGTRTGSETPTIPPGESIADPSYPLLIAAPTHDRVRVKALIPEGATSANIWNGTGGNDGKVPVIYKIIHMLNVTNNSSKTIRGLHLQLFDHWERISDLPIYGKKETKTDLNPGDPPAQFEIAYQFSLRSKHPPAAHAADIEMIPAPMLNAVYYHLKEGSPINGKIGPFGTLDIGRGYIQLADATPIDKVGTQEGILLPSRLQLSANDIPSLYLVLKVSPDKNTGFKIEAIALDAKPKWTQQ